MDSYPNYIFGIDQNLLKRCPNKRGNEMCHLILACLKQILASLKRGQMKNLILAYVMSE
jgi:hypothetical protein